MTVDSVFIAKKKTKFFLQLNVFWKMFNFEILISLLAFIFIAILVGKNLIKIYFFNRIFSMLSKS